MKKSRKSIRRKQTQSKLEFSQLEERRLLAIWLAGDVLNFAGNDQVDQVEFTLTQNGQTVIVTHAIDGVPFQSASFNRAAVNEIAAYPAGGNDTITNDTPIRSTMYGGDGNDMLFGGSDFDRLFGSDGNDMIDGRGGADFVNGLAGDDIVNGGDGTDLIVGDVGNDVLSGGDGADTMLGGEGNDRIMGEGGADRIYAAAGNDFIYGGEGNDPVLAGNDGDDLIYGDQGDDNLFGGNGNDRLLGESGNDQLAGGDGSDILWGGWGNDLLIGGTGNDSLIGIGGVTELEDVQTSTVTHSPHPDPTPLLPEHNWMFGGTGDDNYYSWGFTSISPVGLKRGTDLYSEAADAGNDLIFAPTVPVGYYQFDLDLAPDIGTIRLNEFPGAPRIVRSNPVSNIEGFTTTVPDPGSPV